MTANIGLAFAQPNKQKYPQCDKEHIWKPDQHIPDEASDCAQSVGDDDEEKIRDGDDQTRCRNPIEVSRRCAVTPSGTPTRAKARQENGNEKRLLISVRLALRSRLSPRLQLIQQLLERKRGPARPSFLLFVKFLEADRQRSFRHADAIAHLAQIERIFLIALLITGIVEMHENSFVRQIGFEHARSAQMSLRIGSDVSSISKTMMFSSLFPVFLADVNFSAGKLIDHLVAAEERHRIARREIEDRAAHFFLRRRRDLRH